MKARASNLDPIAEQLPTWFTAAPDRPALTYAQAVAKAKAEHGIDTSIGALSRWHSRWQREGLRERILTRITSGAELSRDIEKKFTKHPAPETAQIVKLLRVLVMQLSVQSEADPALLELVNPLMRSILEFLKTEQKGEALKLDARRVALLEAKAAQADEAEKVTQSSLTPEEKQLKLRQIFGMT